MLEMDGISTNSFAKWYFLCERINKTGQMVGEFIIQNRSRCGGYMYGSVFVSAGGYMDGV